MKSIRLNIELTLSEYDTLLDAITEEWHRANEFLGIESLLAMHCASLLHKVQTARKEQNNG